MFWDQKEQTNYGENDFVYFHTKITIFSTEKIIVFIMILVFHVMETLNNPTVY